MSEIAKTYEPAAVEAKWYDFWLQNECFTADPARVSEKRPAYSIVIPPPNVTGVLTLGHVLNNTIQDILARRARMLGKEVLWLPGTDHAGIATQNVVEKTLRKEGTIKHRDDLGREALVAKIWEWKEKYGGIILKQLRALGASCDWSRTRFTMDEDYSRCVSRVFVDLFKKGQIYRGKRMVNWCPASLTALSDEEVIMKEQNGVLYYFRVEVVEEPGRFLTIATTRPETIPGDTAVAVNSKDPRYADLIGKHVRRPLPLEDQSLLPIIGDDYVTFDFGTGVLKVTPAHDKNDYEIGQRHHLPVIDVMEPNGVMNDLAGADLAGLERFAARKRAAELLTEMGAMEKEEPYKNNVGYSERADVPIEPRLSEQWFLKYPSVKESLTVVADGQMKFHPDRWAKVYDHWLNGIQDWCISRQLWWGHRVPVWSKTIASTDAADFGLGDGFAEIVSKRLHDAQTDEIRFTDGLTTTDLAHAVFNLKKLSDGGLLLQVATIDAGDSAILEKQRFAQDSDVLDTWFSSWLWPFATMGWPEKTDTLAKFYPTADLVTGPDIIFFWVARMIMAGFEYMGELPFRNVYFTGIIRDKNGEKMSKSKGNSPDPLVLVEHYGADAVRLGIMRSAPLGTDVMFEDREFDRYKKDDRYDFAKIQWNASRFPQMELGRNFCTKLWNATRFRQMQGGVTEGEIQPALLTSDDCWILDRLDHAVKEVSAALDAYRFSDATATLYRFFWNEYCDWYVEASKASLQGSALATANGDVPATENPQRANTLAVIDFVLSHTLRLFHPFLPFISEELWHGLGFSADLPEDQGGKTIMTAHWPKPMDADERAYFRLDVGSEQAASDKYETVNLGRSLRRDFNIASSKKVRFVLRPKATLLENDDLSAHDKAVLAILLNAETLDIVDAAWTAPRGTPVALGPLGELFLPLEGLIDVAAERVRLGKEITKAAQERDKARAKLADPNFAAKVPATVLEEHRQRETAWVEKHEQLTRMLTALGDE